MISQPIQENGEDIIKTVILSKGEPGNFTLYTNMMGKHVKTEGTLNLKVDYTTLWDVSTLMSYDVMMLYFPFFCFSLLHLLPEN